MDKIKTRTAMVTGAAGGLGSELSKLLAGNGWQVILLDGDRRGLEKLYDTIVAAGAVEPVMQVLDLSVIGPAECSQLLEAMQLETGRLDALVHCAVSFRGLQPLDLIEPADWLKDIQVNLNVPWLISVLCLPLLKETEGSSLVFFEDEQPSNKALWGAYGVSKAAIGALAAQFRAELINTSVNVHAIDPGPMRTPLRSRVFHSENPAEVCDAAERAGEIINILNGGVDQRKLHIKL